MAFSASARSTGNYRLGNIALHFPYVLFRGGETCNLIKSLLETHRFSS